MRQRRWLPIGAIAGIASFLGAGLLPAPALSSAPPVPGHVRLDGVRDGRHPASDNAPKPAAQPLARDVVAAPLAVWDTVFTETFEGNFPEDNSWSIRYATNSTYSWDDAQFRPHSGAWSGWCADASFEGATDLEPNVNDYPANLNAWTIYGPFDLSDATAAELRFWYWNLSEVSQDLFSWFASSDGIDFWGFRTSGNSNGYQAQIFDLATVPTLGNLTGRPQVWIAFHFASNGSVSNDGAFIDDIVLRRHVDPSPVALHTPVTSATQNVAIPITATITDDGATLSARVHYRASGTTVYTEASLTRAGDQFSGQIPAGAIGARGVDYYLSATDGQSTVFVPDDGDTDPVRVRVDITALSSPSAQPGGGAQNAYRMISIPYQLTSTDVAGLLTDDLGAYDSTRWRLFRYESGNYHEYPDSRAAQIGSGEAMWLIVRDGGRVVDGGPGRSTAATDSFYLTLAPGWNDIGSPFAFPVDWSQVRLARASIDGPYLYEGTWLTPGTVTRLEPWKGYAIRNNTASSLTMAIPSRASAVVTAHADAVVATTLTDAVSAPPLADAAPALPDGAGRFGLPAEVTAAATGGGWFARLEARCADALDAWNTVGWSPLATDGKDSFDYAEPPPIGDYVALSFPALAATPAGAAGSAREAATLEPDALTSDIRAIPAAGHRWPVVITSRVTQPAPVMVSWEGFATLPAGLEVVLLDPIEGVAVEPRRQASYTFEHASRRELLLVVGAPDFVRAETRAVTVPGGYALAQNAPNPFRPHTVVRYQLPTSGPVSLSVYDAQGRELRSLANGHRPAGFHRAAWDGRDATGQPMPSGVYFCRLRAGPFQATRKLVLSR